MIDEPSLGYTINDVAKVECPYCRESMDLSEQVAGKDEFERECDHCGRQLLIQVDVEVTVLAWKPEARR